MTPNPVLREKKVVAVSPRRADFQSRFDKSTAQAIEMKKGALRVL
jgi:hypothetical protein